MKGYYDSLKINNKLEQECIKCRNKISKLIEKRSIFISNYNLVVSCKYDRIIRII